MTCESAAKGQGICYKCYGELAYVNKDINPGRYASEKLSAELTQRLLSAKHLLETVIKKIQWCKEFVPSVSKENILKIIERNKNSEFKRKQMPIKIDIPQYNFTE